MFEILKILLHTILYNISIRQIKQVLRERP